MLLSIVIGSYILLSGTVENVKDMTPKISKSEEKSIIQQQNSGIVLEKTETKLKTESEERIAQVEEIGQDEPIEDTVIKAEKEEDTKKSLKPHHLYVRNTKEMETMILKRVQQKDQEKRLKIFREKNNLKREL